MAALSFVLLMATLLEGANWGLVVVGQDHETAFLYITFSSYRLKEYDRRMLDLSYA